MPRSALVSRPGGAPARTAAALLCLLAVLLRPAPVLPALYQSGETVFLDAPAGDDAYLAGGKVLVTADVAGDTIAAGGSVVVSGATAADLAAAGGSVVVSGEVGDDLRAAGGDLTLSGAVGDDLAAFAGRVAIARGARVGGDATVAAGTIDAACSVAGNARFGGGKILFTGDVAGDGDFFAAERLVINGRIGGRARLSAPEVRLGPAASFGGDVEYWTREGELDFGAAVPAGEARFNPDMTFGAALAGRGDSRKAAAGIIAAWVVLSLLSGALAILLLVLFARGYFGTAAADLRGAFARSFGLGALYFLVAPAAAALLLASVVGIPLGIALLALYLLSLLFAKVLAAVVLARWIELRRGRAWSGPGLFFAAFGIFLALKLAAFVPVAGWAAVLVLVCAAFGAMATADWGLLKRLREPPPVPPAR